MNSIYFKLSPLVQLCRYSTPHQWVRTLVDSGRPSEATRPRLSRLTCFYYIDKPIVTQIQVVWTNHQTVAHVIRLPRARPLALYQLALPLGPDSVPSLVDAIKVTYKSSGNYGPGTSPDDAAHAAVLLTAGLFQKECAPCTLPRFYPQTPRMQRLQGPDIDSFWGGS